MKNIKLNPKSIALVCLFSVTSIALILTGNSAQGEALLAVVLGMTLPQPMKMDPEK